MWDSNLILLPGRWSGDPCLCAWGGQHHVFTNNTCVVTGTDAPLSLDSDVGGSTCVLNYSDPRSAAFLPALARNTYHTATGAFSVGCDVAYSLAQLQALGVEVGSVAVAGYDAGDVVRHARALLGLTHTFSTRK